MINVTRTYLPPLEEYILYLKKIWESGWVTNQGQMVQELERRLVDHLGVKHLQYVGNGTIALQLAIKALDIKGEIITTPFSYVATTSSILWENCIPVFADIEDQTFCIDPDKIEAAITERTTAILATHVYGYPCQVEKIRSIALKHNLKVIYDGAHAFGVKLNGESILKHGDVSTLSLHATKLFHTIEGGAVICNDAEIDRKVYLYKAFGHEGEDYLTIGINGKNSEFHAAMGLCNLPYVEAVVEKRKQISEHYDSKLADRGLIFPKKQKGLEYNYAYYPIIFSNETKLIETRKRLMDKEIFTRRYFNPSLNKLPYVEYKKCSVAEDIATRVMCLPLYPQLSLQEADEIIKHITN